MKRIEEAKSISASDRELLSEVKRIVTAMIPGATLLLYGSAARGEREWDSDYDILVLTDAALTTRQQDDVGSAVYALELEREVVISLLFETSERWNGNPLVKVSPYHQNVEREGMLV